MSFGDGIFGICTFSIVLLLSMVRVRVKLWTIVLAKEVSHISEAFPTQVILWTKKCLVLVFFLPVSALYFRRKCHQAVSLLWLNTWQEGFCPFNISFARLSKAHMDQGRTGVKAMVLVRAFVDFLCTLLWHYFFKFVVIFVSMCFHRHVSLEVWHVCVGMFVYMFSRRNVWGDL